MKHTAEPFVKIEDAFVITERRGVKKMVDLYEWGGDLYANQLGGFLLLRSNGDTSSNLVRWVKMKSPDTTDVSKSYNPVRLMK